MVQLGKERSEELGWGADTLADFPGRKWLHLLNDSSIILTTFRKQGFYCFFLGQKANYEKMKKNVCTWIIKPGTWKISH